ncbi:MAG: single-stranded DNA-binding protein [Bacteroidaceae bacterium]|nr:single-stranded DNA-binding protein [Bacteroidaceae bacterium]
MSLNKVMLIGNVGREPEVRYVDAGVPTAVVSLATTNPGYRLESGAQVPDSTEWHRVILWHKLAEVVERYVHKGDLLYVEGEIRRREWTDKKGHAHEVTEIWAKKLELLTPKSQREPQLSPQPQ